MAKCDSYVICTSPRSGSTLLCKLLARTGVAGNPDSYFHRPSLSAWLDDYDLTPEASMPERDVLAAVFQAAIAEGSLKTGMFGLRLQRDSFNFFTEKLAVLHPGYSSDVERLNAAFGRTSFIYLMRRDKVEQAISLVKAQQTGLWHRAPDGTELERLAPPKEPNYDGDALRAQFDQLTSNERDWEGWFETEGIEPLRLTYEGLSKDPAEGLRRVLDHLGLDGKAASGAIPDVAKLADGTNRDWAARFRSEHNIA
jgi:LPS sulfotransferase NodH